MEELFGDEVLLLEKPAKDKPGKQANKAGGTALFIIRLKVGRKLDLWVKYGDWLAEPRPSAGFDEPEKILIRQTGDTLIAALDTKRFVAMDNLYTIRQRTKQYPLHVLLALLNSSTLRWYYQTAINPERGEALAQVKKGHIVKLPVPAMTPTSKKAIGLLTSALQVAKGTGQTAQSQFLEDLIDACVMECYFREHMAERDLLFLDDVAPHLSAYDSSSSESKQREFIAQLHRTLNAPSSKIRNRLVRITADSPDLLAVIKDGGSI